MMSSNPFIHNVHVLFRREDITPEVIQNKIVVVLDILFATTTIVSAFSDGVKLVIPVRNERNARLAADGLAKDSFVLAGELYAETINGFASPTPLALGQTELSDKILIYSTTNGTVALQQSSAAHQVFVGSLLNAKAVVSHICDIAKGKQIVIICSGSMGLPNLEDTFGAGYFVNLLRSIREDAISNYSDASLVAERVYQAGNAADILFSSRVGRLMVERGKENEVNYASKLSSLDLVPVMENHQVTILR